MMLDEHDTEVQKFKRLAFLYFLGIPIPAPYSDIFKAFDDFYDCYEKVELLDFSGHNVLCGIDKEHNILFVLSDELNKNFNGIVKKNTQTTLIYTEIYSGVIQRLEKNMREDWKQSSKTRFDILREISKIVANRYGIEFEHLAYYGSKTYYIGKLEEGYKNSKLGNLAGGQ